jgi:hypothetical protein
MRLWSRRLSSRTPGLFPVVVYHQARGALLRDTLSSVRKAQRDFRLGATGAVSESQNEARQVLTSPSGALRSIAAYQDRHAHLGHRLLLQSAEGPWTLGRQRISRRPSRLGRQCAIHTEVGVCVARTGRDSRAGVWAVKRAPVNELCSSGPQHRCRPVCLDTAERANDQSIHSTAGRSAPHQGERHRDFRSASRRRSCAHKRDRYVELRLSQDRVPTCDRSSTNGCPRRRSYRLP